MDCSLPGSSVHGIFQAKVLEWGAIAFSQQVLYIVLKGAALNLPVLYKIPGVLKINLVVTSVVFISLILGLYLSCSIYQIVFYFYF